MDTTWPVEAFLILPVGETSAALHFYYAVLFVHTFWSLIPSERVA